MKLRSLRERDLIAAIRKDFSGRSSGLLLGIGDDAAAVKGDGKSFLLTTDLLVENVHFITALQPAFYLGRKALNVNLSDIAAMGGRPRFALLGLGLKEKTGPAWVSGFFRGLKEAAGEFGVRLIGGDISASERTVISLTIIAEGKNFIARSGAKESDLIFVSGTLGDAAAGLRLLKRGFRPGKDKKADSLLQAFIDPVPRVALGQALSRRRIATAMIDTSDGLSTDLSHICEESHVGAEVYLEKIPLSPGIRLFERRPLDLALHGGEDYQLLFTVALRSLPVLAKLPRRFKAHFIGRVTSRKGVRVVDSRGKRRPLQIKGYEHFT